MLDERGLHRVKIAGPPETFDGRDLLSFMHDRECQAGIDAAAIDDDGAGAALAVIAAFLRPSEMEVLAQRIEKGGPVIQRQMLRFSVDLKDDFRLFFHDFSPNVGRAYTRRGSGNRHRRG